MTVDVRRRWTDVIAWAIAVMVIIAASAHSGGTEHVSAWCIRALAVVSIWVLLRGSPKVTAPSWFGFFMALAFLIWLTSESLGRGSQTFSTAVVALSLGTAWSRATAQQQQRLIFSGLGVACLHAIWIIIQVLSTTRPAGGFFDPNQAAAFLVVWLVAALFLPTGSRRIRIIAATLLVTAILMTRSRSGAVTTIAVLALAMNHVPRRWRWHAVALAGIALTAAVALTWQRWTGEGDWYAYERLSIWRACWLQFTEHPFGAGLGSFADVMRERGIELSGPVRFPRTASHGHSFLFHHLVEVGALFVVGLGASVVVTMRGLLKGDRQQRTADIAIAAAALGPALVSDSLRVPVVAFSVVIVWAILRPRPAQHGGHRVDRRLIMAATLLALVAVTPDAASWIARERALVKRTNQQLEPALAWSRWARDLAPWRSAPAMLNASLAFASQQPLENVLTDLETIASLHRRRPEPYERMAWLMARAKHENPQAKAQQVGKVRQLAAERDPKNALSRLAEAQAWLTAEQTALAQQAIDQALEVEPACADCLVFAAKLNSLEQKPSGALLHRAAASQEIAHRYRGYSKRLLSLSPEFEKMHQSLQNRDNATDGHKRPKADGNHDD